MIECRNVSFSYKKKNRQIDDISLKLEEGYFTCLIGHNGAGKTTLMKLLYGSLLPDSGTVEKDGSVLSIDSLCEHRSGLFFVTKEAVWHPDRPLMSYSKTLAKLYPKYSEEEFLENLRKLDFISGKDAGTKNLDKTFSELSYGERMKVITAFGLATHPEYMILDEPFANLDPLVKSELARMIHTRVTKDGMGVLISTHLLDEVSDMADYVAVMEKGRLVKYGDREEIMSNTDLRTVLRESRETE